MPSPPPMLATRPAASPCVAPHAAETDTANALPAPSRSRVLLGTRPCRRGAGVSRPSPTRPSSVHAIRISGRGFGDSFEIGDDDWAWVRGWK